jgi:hypothetical protein
MATIVFYTPVKPDEKALAHALLVFWQRIAREHSLSLVFHWQKPHKDKNYHHYHVTITGSLTAAQVFLNTIMGISQAFVTGYVAADKKNSKTLLGTVFPLCYTKALLEFTEDIGKVVDYCAAKGIRIEPNSYFFDTQNVPDLGPTLNALSKSIILYTSNQIGSEQLAEQAHTATELLLKTSLSATDRKTYAELVLDAHDKGLITDKEKYALIGLKNYRRGSKHHGKQVPDEIMASYIQPIVSASQGLIAQIRSIKKPS